jgi:hypothetical protein
MPTFLSIVINALPFVPTLLFSSLEKSVLLKRAHRSSREPDGPAASQHTGTLWKWLSRAWFHNGGPTAAPVFQFVRIIYRTTGRLFFTTHCKQGMFCQLITITASAMPARQRQEIPMKKKEHD